MACKARSCKQQAAFLLLQETASAQTAGHQHRIGMIKSQSAAFQGDSGDSREGTVDKTNKCAKGRDERLTGTAVLKQQLDAGWNGSAALRRQLLPLSLNAGLLSWGNNWPQKRKRENMKHWHLGLMPQSDTCVPTSWLNETLLKLLEFLNCKEWNLMRVKGSEKWEVRNPFGPDSVLTWSWMNGLVTWRETDCLCWERLIVRTKIAPRFDGCWISEMLDDHWLKLWMHSQWRKSFMMKMTPVKVCWICLIGTLVTKTWGDDKLNWHLACWITIGSSLQHQERCSWWTKKNSRMFECHQRQHWSQCSGVHNPLQCLFQGAADDQKFSAAAVSARTMGENTEWKGWKGWQMWLNENHNESKLSLPKTGSSILTLTMFCLWWVRVSGTVVLKRSHGVWHIWLMWDENLDSSCRNNVSLIALGSVCQKQITWKC